MQTRMVVVEQEVLGVQMLTNWIIIQFSRQFMEWLMTSNKTQYNRGYKIMKKIWIATIAISTALALGACGKQTQAETVPTTIEATTVVETTVTETTTAMETTEASNDKYGEYGKEMYDILVADWMEWLYADEGELRLNATAMLGSISEENYEAIIQEILAMDRGQNPYAASQAAALGQPLPSESAPVQETQASSKESKAVETQTQPTQKSEPTQKAEPEVQPTQSSSDDSMISEEEANRIIQEVGIGTPEGDTINSADGWSGDIDAADFNWHQ